MHIIYIDEKIHSMLHKFLWEESKNYISNFDIWIKIWSNVKYKIYKVESNLYLLEYPGITK